MPASILGAWDKEEGKTRFLPSKNLHSGDAGGERDRCQAKRNIDLFIYLRNSY